MSILEPPCANNLMWIQIDVYCHSYQGYNKYVLRYTIYMKTIQLLRRVLLLWVSSTVVLLSVADVQSQISAPARLAAPLDLSARDLLSGSIEVSWSLGSGDVTSVKVERAVNPAYGFSQIANVPANSTSYIDLTTNGKRFFYRVKASSALAESSYSQIVTPSRIERLDLLTGIGDFERFHSVTAGKVADGWYLRGPLAESSNAVAEVEVGKGIGGSNRQKISIKGINSEDYTYVYLEKTFQVGRDIQFDDTLTFSIDAAELSLTGNIAQGAVVNSVMHLSTYHPRGEDSELKALYDQIKFDHKVYLINNAVKHYTLEAHLPKLPIGATEDLKNNLYVSFSFTLGAKGNILDSQPSLVLDNAHIYLTRNGKPEMTVIPVERNRLINTQKYFFSPSQNSLHESAKKYDAIMAGGTGIYEYLSQFKYFNPNMKIYGYQTATIYDRRDNNYHDPPVDNSSYPLGFAAVIDTHPEWLFEYPEHTSVQNPPGDKRAFDPADPGAGEIYKHRLFKNDGISPLPFVFQEDYQQSYYARLGNALYQEQWRQAVTDIFKQRMLDGLFIDDVTFLKVYGTRKDPNTGKEERVEAAQLFAHDAQSFVHSVIPFIRNEAGIEIIVNACSYHYDVWPGKIVINPEWDPANPGPTPPNWQGAEFEAYKDKYSVNTPDNTPDIFFQEHAFMTLNWVLSDLRNRYDATHWEESLKDMEMVLKWNGPGVREKKVFQSVNGIDRPDVGDPAFHSLSDSERKNLNAYDWGWAKFGLGSFLLASNAHCWLGVELREAIGNQWGAFNNAVDPGFALSIRLGAPSESRVKHLDLYSDGSLQTRKFEHGIVVVNGNPNDERQYKTDMAFKDEYERPIPKYTKLILKAHSARILFYDLSPNPPSNLTLKEIR